MACKSPTHKRYSQAIEGLFIQAWIAQQDFAKLLNEVDVHGDAGLKGEALALQMHRLDEVVERIEFGKSELEIARRAVDAHLHRGCSNLIPV